jgi:hypothetical protein
LDPGYKVERQKFKKVSKFLYNLENGDNLLWRLDWRKKVAGDIIALSGSAFNETGS